MSNNLPLSNIRVIDLTNVIMGPFTTQLLGDLGADIIKVEDINGDMTREIGPSKSSKMATMYLGVNRNKRSITLNLKKNKSKEVLWKMIKTADIFIHNMRPEKLKKLGFSPKKIINTNKKIIFVGLYGYGNAGSYSGQPAYDDIIQGLSGLADLHKLRDGEPSFVPSVIADKSIGLLASTALLASYIKSLKTGKGCCIEISMFEGMAAYVLLEHQHGDIFNPAIDNAGYPRLLSKSRKPYRTADGYICILPYTNKQWFKFFDIIDMKELKNDERFSKLKARSHNINTLYRIIEKNVKNKTNNQLCKLLKKNDIPHGVVNTLNNLKNDKHLKKVNFFREINHSTEGRMYLPDTGIKIDNESLPVRYQQPFLGEHNKEILIELGYNMKEINKIVSLNKKIDD